MRIITRSSRGISDQGPLKSFVVQRNAHFLTVCSPCPPGPKKEPVRNGSRLLGHSDVKTTMIYTHVLNRGGLGVQSPADRLLGGPSKEC